MSDSNTRAPVCSTHARGATSAFLYCLEQEFYKLETVRTTDSPAKQIDRLYQRLIAYRDASYKPEIYKACNVLLADLEFRLRTTSLVHPWPSDELTAIRLIIADHIKNHNKPTSQSIEEVRNLMQLEQDFFGEVDEK